MQIERLALMSIKRAIAYAVFFAALFAVPATLLCSEPTPEHCHRRLVTDYLRNHWEDFPVKHL